MQDHPVRKAGDDLSRGGDVNQNWVRGDYAPDCLGVGGINLLGDVLGHRRVLHLGGRVYEHNFAVHA